MKKKIKAMAGYGMKKKSTKGYMKAQSGPSMSTPKVGSRRRVTDTYDPSVEYISTDKDFGRKENEALAAKKELMRKKAAATKAGYNKARAGGAKPDYLDMDGDGNKNESMKSAIRSKKGMGGNMMQKGMGGTKMYKAAGAKNFKPHMMYDPKTGKGYKANTYEDHVRMDKKGYTHKKSMIKAEAGNMKSNFLEPATPRMFEDGGLKDLRKEQRGERKQLRSKNKKLKSSAKDIAKATKRGTRTASKTIKRITKKFAKIDRKNTRSAAKNIRQTSRKNIAALKGRGAKTQENKSIAALKGKKIAATKVSVAAKEKAPKLEKMPTKSAGKLPVDRRTGAGTLAGGTSGGNALARQKGETSRAKDDLARKNKTGQYETYSQAYRKQRDANKKAGIANYGNPKGYFTYKGKKYNTESKSEKAARLKKGEKKPKAKAEEGFKFE